MLLAETLYIILTPGGQDAHTRGTHSDALFNYLHLFTTVCLQTVGIFILLGFGTD